MKYLTILCAILFLLSCQNVNKSSESTDANAHMAQLLADYHLDYLEHYPLEATSNGIDGYNDKFPINISESYRQKLRDFYNKYDSGLDSIDRAQLDDMNQTSYDVLAWECDIRLRELDFPTHLTPINQFYSMQNTIGQYASGMSSQPFKTVEDYENWIVRVGEYLVWCDTAIANMRKGMATGYVLPKMLTLKVIPQVEGLSQGSVEDHLFYGPVKFIPDGFTDDEKENITNTYSTLISEEIIPKYQQLTAFFKDEYLPACRETSGIWDTPNGGEFYQHRIKYYTTTSMTADEIFELGQSEVDRLMLEMEKVKNELGFEGDMKAFFADLRTKKELTPYTDPQQVIDHFNEIHEKMKPQLENLFDMVPKAEFEVRRTEAFREKSASAEYSSPSLDGSRPGIFYVPIPNVREYNILSDEDLFLHEAIPGHHYQGALQQENDSLPDFRKILYYSAFGEGWALYSESLGKELGLYTDPYQYLGMLMAEMHRAIRLVVDAGMHAKKWTREEAIQYSLDHEAKTESDIIAEIERYMSWPGQALSYKVGQLKIRELRAKAENELGENFDIKEFHNLVLSIGNVSLAVLENEVNEWIAEEKGAV